jgi:hypothetical protein
MSWTGKADLLAQLQRLWERGDFLRSLLEVPGEAEALFPLRIKLKSPGSAELAGRFDAVRHWIAELVALPHVEIEWRELQHRVVGAQRIPQAIVLPNLDSACALAGKRRELARFAALLVQTRQTQPAILPWLAKRPLQALALAAEWERLLAVVAWLQQHPRPGIYLRQVDIAGVDSKFIEAQRAVLAEWLDLALPPEAIDVSQTGVARFAARYGFLDKPLRIRWRSLDAGLALLPLLPPLPPWPTLLQGEGSDSARLPDVTLDAASFARLALPITHVFITENETNFLAFPEVKNAIVIFGAGYGWQALAQAQWLHRCTIHYWGDIDTHGFAILDSLRSHFAHVESFLMDLDTLLAHESLWGVEGTPINHELAHLTVSEREVYDTLRDNRIRPGLRLEQERIGFERVQQALN